MSTPAQVGATTTLWIDGRSAIVRVNEAWNAFALQNDGAACTSPTILGRPLREFVTGDATRMLLDAMLQRVALHGRELEYDYRCDAPGLKRYMRMRLTPEAGLIRFDHTVLRTEPLAPATRFDAAPQPRGGLDVRCSMCNAVKVQGEWLEPDVARARGALAERNVVAYGVCAACQDVVHSKR